MKNQKFLITKDENEVNEWINQGWEIISVTAQHVAAAGSHSYSETLRGKFAIVLQKQKSEN
jgi:hypothetical protein